MAGEARTNAFNIGTATVMIGPQNALYDLNVTDHGIGLVKNVTISSELSFVDLTQGLPASTVYSTMSANTVSGEFEVYEYTSKNLAYGLSLDGSGFAPVLDDYSLNAALTGNTATPVTTATFITDTAVISNFLANQWIMFQSRSLSDNVHYARLSINAASTGTAPTITNTLTFAGFGLKTGNNFAAGDRVGRANLIRMGARDAPPFFSMKIIGVLPESNRPVGILLPKVRITRGFSVGFNSENYGNMPFQFRVMDLVTTDPFFADFGTGGRHVGRLLTNF